VRAILRRMHPRLTLEPPDLAFALLSSLIDFEVISANHHPLQSRALACCLDLSCVFLFLRAS
jgi:hypothetical protein